MQAVRRPVGGGEAGRHQGLGRYLPTEDPAVATIPGLSAHENVRLNVLEFEELQDIVQRFGHATDLRRSACSTANRSP